ncbi:hypothetical protein [Amycolatopsis jiangsuensis]|uniref:Uncharacterized protein n=1 Tax=Amycolatopsis jiangsuensis TaxID=1181879 RepID=A0A840J8V0_9PSEU|nr:hypothetical protein [Amycolatopsis jiangsuensis]MBB4689818.1 hypothetical protein [Amycolatopsis jiangsuensis]
MTIKRAWPVALQCGGGAIAAAGLYGLVGLLWTAVVVGVALLALGTVAEAKGGA